MWLVPLVVAGPPPNDTCAGAEVIPTAGPFPYLTAITDLTSATTNGDPAAPSCVFGSVNRGIWYRFTPPSTQLYTISCSGDTATTVQDTVMAIYTGSSCASLSEVACSDDEGDLQSAVSTSLTGGGTYYILVWVSGASAPLGNNTNVQLRVTQPVAPTNDTCAGAEVIPPGGPFPYLTFVADTTLATTTGDPPAPSCYSPRTRSVWFRYTPDATAQHELSLCTNTATTIYETLMAVYTSPGGCAGPFTQVACNHTNPCGNRLRSTIATTLTNGMTYYIVAWEGDTDPYIPGETSLQLRVARFLPPAASTTPANSITSTSAVLNASVNPNGLPTTAWFDWGTTTNYGSTTSAQSLGSGGNNLAVTAMLSGLAPAATYHFRIRATNSLGASLGADASFTLLPLPPSATTLDANSLTSTGATLNATVNPRGGLTRVRFDYGATTNYGSSTATTNIGSGSNNVVLNQSVTGLQQGQLHHFRIVATNSGGTALGNDLSFAWSAAPPIVTSFAYNNGAFALQFTGQPGQLYFVEASMDFITWIALGLAGDLGNGTFTFTDTNSLATRFYRAHAP